MNHDKPKVLFLDHVGVLGGAELVLLDTAAHFAARCHVVLMADGPLRPALQAVGAPVTVFTAPSRVNKVRRAAGLFAALGTVIPVLRLARKIARFAGPYDLIWANSQKSFVIGCFASFLSGKPLVWHMHDILTADHFSPVNRKVGVFLANRFAARVVAVSRAGRQSFIDAGGDVRRVTVVYNGLDAADFTPGKNSPDLRVEFDTGSAPLVGVFGRLTAWKGQDILIRALPKLPNVHAVFVGEALFNEHEYAASLRTLAAELNVADRCHFTGFRSNIPELMSGVDVVAHTSTAPEPFGRVIVEAMLAGKPVIATDAGGAAEIVTHDSDGLLVPMNDPAALAAALDGLLKDPLKSASLAAEGCRTATRDFTIQNFLRGINAVANDAAAAPDAPPVRRDLKALSS